MIIFLTAIAARLIGGSDYLVSAVQAAGILCLCALWGDWSNTGALAAALTGHTASACPNGPGPGGRGVWGWLSGSAELYDPVLKTWTGTGALAAARYTHTATLLPNGRSWWGGVK